VVVKWRDRRARKSGRAGLDGEFAGREQGGGLRRPGWDGVDVQLSGQDQDGRGDLGQLRPGLLGVDGRYRRLVSAEVSPASIASTADLASANQGSADRCSKAA
jgi:hypothetical protein